MKKRTIITTLTAVMTGLSAAALPLAAELPTAIVAEAASNGTYEYSVTNGQVTIEKYLGSSPAVTIPSKINGMKVVKIADYAFSIPVQFQYNPNPMNITSLTFESPSYVTEIGEKAFYGAPLKKVILPASVTTIGLGAFCGCSQMKSLEIKGRCQIGDMAFESCSAMTSVKIHKDSVAESSAFSYCTSLTSVNRASANAPLTFTYTTDAAGRQKPILTTDSYARKVIANCFETSTKVKFMDDYITALCNYVVKTETSIDKKRTEVVNGVTQQVDDDWMPEAIKARQLYDWLIRHCQYEDDINQVYNDQSNNNAYSAVFISYALNQRGEGIGEAVCEGFASAYNMLLQAAGIESYLLKATPAPGVGGLSHIWNLVKINGKYYQCDACWDDGWTNTSPNVYYLNNWGTSYHFFLKSDTQMKTAHNGGLGEVFRNPVIYNLTTNPADTHPLFCQNNPETGKQGLKNCYYNFGDANEDGILDNNFNLNTSYTTDDLDYLNATVPYFNNGFVLDNNSLPVFFTYLVNSNLSPVEILYRTWNGQHIS